jgi:hypothetical protein
MSLEAVAGRRAPSVVAPLVVIALSLLTPSRHAHAASGACAGGWRVEAAASVARNGSVLAAVDAVRVNDVWAVGQRSKADRVRTLVEHWDGAAWSVVRSPNPGEFSELFDVSAVAADDIWAVGDADGSVLTEHWDGRAWSIVPAPFNGELDGVIAETPTFALAVGFVSGRHRSRPLALRWTGSGWVSVPTDLRGTPQPQALAAIDASGTSDAWGVGDSAPSFPMSPLAQHWNGTRFSTVQTQASGDDIDVLNGVSAVSADDAWAVGESTNITVHTSTPSLIEHWNGRAWRIVPSPDRPWPGFDHFYTHLESVDAVNGDDVWAVGATGAFHDESPGAPSRRRTLTLHWTGRRWRLVSSPNAFDIRNSELNDVTALPDGHVWAVGSATNSSGVKQRGLVLSRC